MTQNLLKIENVKKAYRKYNLIGKEISKFSALNGLNLNVGKGQIYGFLGPNGAGKTTTIKCITGILKCDEGAIFIDEKNIEDNGFENKNKKTADLKKQQPKKSTLKPVDDDFKKLDPGVS